MLSHCRAGISTAWPILLSFACTLALTTVWSSLVWTWLQVGHLTLQLEQSLGRQAHLETEMSQLVRQEKREVRHVLCRRVGNTKKYRISRMRKRIWPLAKTNKRTTASQEWENEFCPCQGRENEFRLWLKHPYHSTMLRFVVVGCQYGILEERSCPVHVIFSWPYVIGMRYDGVALLLMFLFMLYSRGLQCGSPPPLFVWLVHSFLGAKGVSARHSDASSVLKRGQRSATSRKVVLHVGSSRQSRQSARSVTCIAKENLVCKWRLRVGQMGRWWTIQYFP